MPNGSSTSTPYRAYAFRAVTGTEYVVVGGDDHWICVLFGGFGSGEPMGRCATSALLMENDARGLELVAQSGNKREIIGLLPRGTTVRLDGTHRVAVHDGIFAIVVHGDVTVTARHDGRTATMTSQPRID